MPRSDFCPLYGLVVTDPRALPALKWACNHYFAGTLVRLLKRAQALCPAFAQTMCSDFETGARLILFLSLR